MNKALLILCIGALTFSSCKSHKPTSRPAPPPPAVVREEPAPPAPSVTAPQPPAATVPNVVSRSENVVMAAGESGAVQRFNVIVGSFQNFNNAQALKTKMTNRGYNVKLLQNPQGMYRVCVFSSNNEGEARNQVNRVRTAYPDEFQDAWLLIAQ